MVLSCYSIDVKKYETLIGEEYRRFRGDLRACGKL
jgi:hypothetical protein